MEKIIEKLMNNCENYSFLFKNNEATKKLQKALDLIYKNEVKLTNDTPLVVVIAYYFKKGPILTEKLPYQLKNKIKIYLNQKEEIKKCWNNLFENWKAEKIKCLCGFHDNTNKKEIIDIWNNFDIFYKKLIKKKS